MATKQIGDRVDNSPVHTFWNSLNMHFDQCEKVVKMFTIKFTLAVRVLRVRFASTKFAGSIATRKMPNKSPK